MKVRIEIQQDLQEEEVIIKTPVLNEKTQKIYELLMQKDEKKEAIIFFQGNKEYYFPVEKILFFETEEGSVSAHTSNQVFQTNFRLYELEEMLPGNFMRVSKSTILNLNHIYSITKNITSSSEVQFENTHKQVYVSRHYYKPLKSRLEEKRKNL